MGVGVGSSLPHRPQIEESSILIEFLFENKFCRFVSHVILRIKQLLLVRLHGSHWSGSFDWQLMVDLAQHLALQEPRVGSVEAHHLIAHGVKRVHLGPNAFRDGLHEVPLLDLSLGLFELLLDASLHLVPHHLLRKHLLSLTLLCQPPLIVILVVTLGHSEVTIHSFIGRHPLLVTSRSQHTPEVI